MKRFLRNGITVAVIMLNAFSIGGWLYTIGHSKEPAEILLAIVIVVVLATINIRMYQVNRALAAIEANMSELGKKDKR